MDLRRTAVTALLLLGLAATANGQSPSASSNSRTADAASPAFARSPIDATRLPIDVRRIERQFRQSSDREERDGPHLRYFVDVYAQAPPIRLFAPTPDLFTGPVPYGAPTHAEMLNQMTPREYRAPAANFVPLIRWLADKARGND